MFFTLTSFSESPLHFEAKLLADTLKKDVLPVYFKHKNVVKKDETILRKVITVATAFASIVLPVPGGPKSKTPFKGLRIPLKYEGIKRGSKTAS